MFRALNGKDHTISELQDSLSAYRIQVQDLKEQLLRLQGENEEHKGIATTSFSFLLLLVFSPTESA